MKVYIVLDIMRCSECAKIVKWSQRQATYLFRQHALQGSDFKDPEVIVVELRRLGQLDTVAEREAVRIVRKDPAFLEEQRRICGDDKEYVFPYKLPPRRDIG